MRYSEIVAISAVLANGAVAAPQFGIWPFYYSSQSAAATSTSAKTSCSSTVKSSTSSAAASVVASSSVKTSSGSAVVVASTSSSSSSSASSTSKASVLSTSSSASSTSVAAPSTSSSAASSTVVVSSTSTSSSAYVTPTIVASDDGYNYQFCAIEPFENGVPGGRAFTGDSFSDPSMTVDLCGDFCSNLNYTLFGVEYADECYCGNSFAAGTTLDVNNDCNMACAGDNTEYCGGAGAMNVYEIAGGAAYTLPTTYTYTATATATATAAGVGSGSAASSTASATPVPAAGGFNYVSCAVEPFEQSGLSYRALQDDSTSSSNMTVAACATYCSGYAYFGVEYSSQCYCGNTIAAGTTQDVTDATCNMACAGDATEQCGGAGRMNLYENSANGGVQTSLATTYIAPATSTSSSAVATSSAAAASTTSSVVVSSTSSASSSSVAATVSSSSSAAATTVKSSSTVVPTTMATSTKSASTTASASASATPGVCAPQGSTDLTTCPTLSVGSLFGNAKYTNYYKGTGYTLNPVNPGSLLNKIFPPKVFTFSGSHSMCSAASQCLQQAGLAATLYHNIDLHWQTDSCQWSCTMQQGINTQPSFFNVAKPSTVSHGCGFSGGLW